MTPLERAAEEIRRALSAYRLSDGSLPPRAYEIAAQRAANALHPKVPEPERIEAMADAIWPGAAIAERGDADAAYAAERRFLGLEDEAHAADITRKIAANKPKEG